MTAFDWEARTVNANGHRIRVHIAGDSGPLVILCHGFPESWYSWRHQLDALSAAGYRAVALEMRGYGRSYKPTHFVDYRITELVADAVGVVEALGEKSAIIMGHDWGAPVAWASAWTRPDVFKAVVGMSVPFGGRGLHALPGDPFGDIRPSVAHRQLAAPDALFYQEHHRLPGGVGEADAEKDIRSWMTNLMVAVSAQATQPPGFEDADLTKLSSEKVLEYVAATMSLPLGEGYSTVLPVAEELPSWITESDIDVYVSEFEYSGFTGALNYYRAQDLNWEILAAYQGTKLSVPALFLGGDKDIATIWGQDAITRADEALADNRGQVIVEDCGHWIQQERPDIVNKELLNFLQGLD